ncbi:energy transducer TonB [Roseibium salinum]|uniref:TonB family protein n=1 Tax=Roseibium salinum TaxID=1604349 RepID=A0ABT3QX51_9HYPH|nr:TonB family protein [Roseibium sp. DSM 29163]MCX2721418.1 TonB family protein [Roseibium sp. DSM 29163]
MIFRTRHWLIAGVLSLGAHYGGAAVSLQAPPAIEIAGGSPAPATTLGQAFSTTVTAGSPTGQVVAETEVAETAEPVQPETVIPVETSQETAAAPAEQAEPVKPAPTETKAVTASVEPQRAETVEALTPEALVSEEAAEPVEAAKPVDTVIAEAVGVPPTKPDIPKRTAPEPRRVKNSKTSKGEEGRARRTAQEGGSTDTGRSRQAGNAAVSNYPGKVASKLRRSVRYPASAKRRNITGVVEVAFVVNSSGSVGSIRVVQSSGHAELDKAALDTVRRAAPFPQIPAGAGRTSWPFSVPLSFK